MITTNNNNIHRKKTTVYKPITYVHPTCVLPNASSEVGDVALGKTRVGCTHVIGLYTVVSFQYV